MEIHLSGLCDVRRAENDAKRSVKPHAVRHREIGLNLSAVGYSLGWVSAVESRGPNSLEERRKVEKLEATLACLAATLKEQAVQTQKRSAQLEASKPAPRVANNPRAASAPTKKN